MKTSELIGALSKIIELTGDVEVLVWEDDICQHRKIHGVSHSVDENAIVIDA